MTGKIIKYTFSFTALMAALLVSGCDETSVTGDDLTGEWIDASKADTIFFMDDKNFYHSSKHMRYDHYDYAIHGDSIEIGYNGMMMILVLKTRHYFELKGDELMIDLSNKQCFGFPKEKMHYKRIQKFIQE